ncbi:MAG TPA: hypothetical protein VME19_09505 [Streptosporangiaceae bacterium]|nr:hypothetical protein [Streptosporangiaceae bacterium]
MAKSMFMAWASPVDDASDSEFNAWYEGTHVPQIRAAVPAITAVYRYRVADVPGVGAAPTHRYLAVYEMDTDDVAGAMAALGAASAEGRIDMTTTIDLTANPPVLHWFHAVTG